jgi:copper(I)-binding protein
MTRFQSTRLARIGLLALCVTAPLAFAHGTNHGDLQLNHSYGMASETTPTQAWVYFRSLRNAGDTADRLLSASTPVAASVALQRHAPQGGDAQAAGSAAGVAAIELPAQTTIPMDHRKGAYRLLLQGLKHPLQNGDRFDLTLRFERAGAATVQVWMQAAP